jgi:hypothetical protein
MAVMFTIIAGIASVAGLAEVRLRHGFWIVSLLLGHSAGRSSVELADNRSEEGTAILARSATGEVGATAMTIDFAARHWRGRGGTRKGRTYARAPRPSA